MQTTNISRTTILSIIAALSAACGITSGPCWDIVPCWDCTVAREPVSYTHLRLDANALAALQALADACDAAPWGQQPGEHGRVFVRDWGGWPQDDSRTTQICVDGLPVVTVRFGWDMEAQHAAIAEGVMDSDAITARARTVTRVTMHDRSAERAARDARRAAGREANTRYEALLDEAAEYIRSGRLPAGWMIWDGQKGGRISTAAGEHVGCAGALRRAGITPGDDASEILREHLAATGWSRPRLNTRSRRLPACDRRRAAEVSL